LNILIIIIYILTYLEPHERLVKTSLDLEPKKSLKSRVQLTMIIAIC